MNVIKYAWPVAIAVSLCGCAGGPVKRPPMASSGTISIDTVAQLPASGQLNNNAVPVGQSQYVLAQSEGGSIFLGPILGSMHVRHVTKEMARKSAESQSVFDIDPASIAAAAIVAEGMPEAGPTSSFTVKPYVYGEHCTDGNFRFSLIYQVESHSATPWVGRYTFNLPVPIPDSRLSTLDEAGRATFRTELEQGAAALAQLVHRDLEGKLPIQGRKVKIGSLWIVGERIGGLGIYTQPEDIAVPAEVVEESDGFVTIRVRNPPLAVGPAYVVERIRRDLIHTLKPAT